MILNRFRILIFPVILMVLSCGDPLSDREDIVRILAEGLMTSGQYSIFWDGRDNKNQFVEAGTYFALLYTQDFSLIDTLTALAGGTKEKTNWNQYDYHNPQLMDEMENNEPDPFYIVEGTNIRFRLSRDINARLTIQKPKE